MLLNATNIGQDKADMRLEPLIQKVASNVYARNHATTMIQLGMERSGGREDSFPRWVLISLQQEVQVYTN